MKAHMCSVVLSCNASRRLNNNSLSGAFPVFLAKISELAFLWVFSLYLWILSVCFIVLKIEPICNKLKFSYLKTWFIKYYLMKLFCLLLWWFRDLSYNNLSGPVPKFPARTFKYHFLPEPLSTGPVTFFFQIMFSDFVFRFSVAGNPLICGSSSTNVCSGSANSVPLSFSLNSSPGTFLGIGPFITLNHFNYLAVIVNTFIFAY